MFSGWAKKKDLPVPSPRPMNSVSKTGGGLELWRGKHSFAKGRLVKSPWKKIDIQSELQKKYVDITEYDKYASIVLKACVNDNLWDQIHDSLSILANQD